MKDLKAKGYFIFESFGESKDYGEFGFYIETNFSYNDNIYKFYIENRRYEEFVDNFENARGYELGFELKIEFIDEHTRVFPVVKKIIDDAQKVTPKGYGRFNFEDKIIRYLDNTYISLSETSVYSTDDDFERKRIGVNMNAKWDFGRLQKFKKSEIIDLEIKIKNEKNEKTKETLEKERMDFVVPNIQVSIVNNPDFNFVFLHNRSIK